MLSVKWLRLLRCLLTMAVVLVMGMIYSFSAAPGEASHETSGSITTLVLRVLCPDYDELPAERQEMIWQDVEHYIRKAGHFSEYALLGLLSVWMMASWLSAHPGLWGWSLSAVFAVTDEYHQLFVADRSASGWDVCLDAVGAAFGMALALMVLRWISRQWQKKQA